MHYKLLGFSQHDCVRHFVFQRVLGCGTAAAEYTVAADVALARTFGISLQELPSLCSRLLEARPEDSPSDTISVTDADLKEHAAANLAAAQEREAKRAVGSRQGVIAAPGRIEDNVTSQHSVIGCPSQR
jgi:hypothetical protein